MMANILELRQPLDSRPALTAEYPIRTGVAPEAVLRELPAEISQRLSKAMKAFGVLHRGLLLDQELTGIRWLRLTAWMPSATSLESHLELDAFIATVALPALEAGPEWAGLLADLLRAQALYPGPQDTRLPQRFFQLAGLVAPWRHLLEKIRRQDRQQAGFTAEILKPLGGEDPDSPLDPGGQTHQLIIRFRSREDWRERDVLHLLLDFVEASPRLFGNSLLNSCFTLKRLQDEDAPAYNRAVAALINEGRGYLGELPRWRRFCRGGGSGRRGLWEDMDVSLVQQAVMDLAGLSEAENRAPGAKPWEPSQERQDLQEESWQGWERGGLPLKPLEKASLFLAGEFFPHHPGYRRFCRFLLEHEESYRQLLATCYAPLEVQQDHLNCLLATFNQHPANAEAQLHLEPAEAKRFLSIIFLRPDPVEAIIDREWQKDLYHSLPGLKGQALLPQVLHECQNIFRCITPEVVARVARGLTVPPREIVRVIASYKEFSADPAGQTVIYICKGTACFLRGQPLLSRALAQRLGVAEGQVSAEGVQFLERDCFGACNLAPVVKVGQTFIGQVQPAETPEMVARLLRGPSYANRTDFFRAVRDSLAEVDQVTTHLPCRLASGQPWNGRPEWLAGLTINGLGEVWAWPEGRFLGTLMDRSYPFRYRDRSGQWGVGALVVDEDDFLVGAVQVTDLGIEQEIRRLVRPRAFLRQGQVYLEGRRASLGEHYSSSIVVATPEGSYACLAFDEDNLQAPPEEERSLPEFSQRPPPPEFFSRQDRVVLGMAEGVNPESIDSYLEKGGYQALKKVLGYGQAAKRWAPEAIIREITTANLRGRGGAGFPTGTKWQAMLKVRSHVLPEDEVGAEVKLMVANGDEGDPGAFMDRTLIQERPHQLLEGMLIGALATGCRYGVIYVRKEYEDAVQRLENAVFEARRYGYLGNHILGQEDISFDVEIRLGAGAFVAGEKRAIMKAIEGRAAEPELKAVSNVKRGLWGKSTLLNNVETLANVPLIINRGGAWFRDLGHGMTGGTKVFSVAGIVNHTGLVEVRFGRTLRDIIHIAGGVKEGKLLAGVQIGGPSGAILSLTGIRSYLLGAPLDFDTFDRVGAMIGSGGLVFLGEDDDVVRLARHFTDWLADESCGQCPACLDGLVSLGATLDRVLTGEATYLDVHLLWGKADIIRAGSNCGLGQTAPNPVTSSLRFFPVAYLHYLLDHPGIDTLELLQSLESLRLITREETLALSYTAPQSAAYTLKKGLIRFIWEELDKRDRYRPAAGSRSRKFLKLLDLSEPEVGLKGVRREYPQEKLGQGQPVMVGN